MIKLCKGKKGEKRSRVRGRYKRFLVCLAAVREVLAVGERDGGFEEHSALLSFLFRSHFPHAVP